MYVSPSSALAQGEPCAGVMYCRWKEEPNLSIHFSHLMFRCVEDRNVSGMPVWLSTRGRPARCLTRRPASLMRFCGRCERYRHFGCFLNMMFPSIRIPSRVTRAIKAIITAVPGQSVKVGATRNRTEPASRRRGRPMNPEVFLSSNSSRGAVF